MALDIFALIVLLTVVASILGLVIWLAMLPGKIARERNHPQADAIRVGGWLGIPTGGLVWVPVMIWAFVKPHPGRTEGQTGGAPE